MSDFEKNRAEYVTRLEAQVQAMQKELVDIKAQSNWIPKVAGVLDSQGQTGRVTLAFGGKNQTGVVSFTTLSDNSVTDITTSLLELAYKDLIFDRLRAAIEPEVSRLCEGVKPLKAKPQW